VPVARAAAAAAAADVAALAYFASDRPHSRISDTKGAAGCISGSRGRAGAHDTRGSGGIAKQGDLGKAHIRHIIIHIRHIIIHIHTHVHVRKARNSRAEGAATTHCKPYPCALSLKTNPISLQSLHAKASLPQVPGDLRAPSRCAGCRYPRPDGRPRPAAALYTCVRVRARPYPQCSQ
jgi:hypothetical protein